jgi:secreted trypsin-like serine protease
VGGYQADQATTADGQDAQEVLAVDKEFLHPNYTPGPKLNDIMLVKLSSPSLAPLQPLNFDPSLPTDGATLTVIGFGNTQTGGVSSFNLLEVQTQAVSFVACSTNYTAASLQVVDEIMFCDKADAKGSCQGDSGGPLFVGPKGDQVQVGLVSWGLECASPTFPGVNTRGGRDPSPTRFRFLVLFVIFFFKLVEEDLARAAKRGEV